ncbi:cohesin subunit sa-1 [Hordeum vulgare]|nr:cohesin subunit sa-1 [Hordeum vulgare]
MQIDKKSKRKEVMPPKEKEKGKDVVPPSEVTPVHTPGRDDDQPEAPPQRQASELRPLSRCGRANQLCKVIMAMQLEAIPMFLDFTKHFPSMPQDFKLKTNIGCS